MELEQLLKNITIQKIVGSIDKQIDNICQDSRKAKQNSLFVAVKGVSNDGHNYIESVIGQGTKTIVLQDYKEEYAKYNDCCFVVVEDSTLALGLVASNFYGDPTSKITLCGITGTNGKTTTATLLYKLFMELGYKCGLMSTVENIILDEHIVAKQTTPDILTINEYLCKMIEKGCTHCFMEVSSHALAQKRVAGLKYKLAIFSNITLDHLDYHKTFKDYIYAKKLFFDNLDNDAIALINKDDKNAKVMVQNTKAKVKTYGLKGFYDYNAQIMELGFDTMLIDICGKEMYSFLVGEFNAYNLLAIYSSAVCLGEDASKVLEALSKLHAVKGRFDVTYKNDKIAIVDYAHTPDALENVLNTICNIRKPYQDIITVCGCGGDRDKSKRPIMAKIALEYSNKVILTSDNPRSEDPQAILNDMLEGVEENQKDKVLCNIDRKQAIQTAVMLAQKEDIILIAGKGHEDYQEIMGVKHHFDDKEIVEEFL